VGKFNDEISMKKAVYFIQKGANINQKDIFGRNVLHNLIEKAS